MSANAPARKGLASVCPGSMLLVKSTFTTDDGHILGQHSIVFVVSATPVRRRTLSSRASCYVEATVIDCSSGAVITDSYGDQEIDEPLSILETVT